jgi:hypothetical protein
MLGQVKPKITSRVFSPAIDFSGSHEPELSAVNHHLRVAERVMMAMDLRCAEQRALRGEMLTRLASVRESAEELHGLRIGRPANV